MSKENKFSQDLDAMEALSATYSEDHKKFVPRLTIKPEKPWRKLSRILEPESWIVFAWIVSALTVGGYRLIQALGWNL